MLCLLATEYHLGLLKAKLAKYRAQLLEPSKSSSSKGEGFDVMKSGDARVALIGFPSVGKVSDGQLGPQEEGGLSPLPPGCTSSLPLTDSREPASPESGHTPLSALRGCCHLSVRETLLVLALTSASASASFTECAPHARHALSLLPQSPRAGKWGAGEQEGQVWELG